MTAHPLFLPMLGISGTVAGAVIGFLVWWHRSQTEQTRTITRLEVGLFGGDGHDGIGGEVRRLAARDDEVLAIVRRSSDLTHEFIGRVSLAEHDIERLAQDVQMIRADQARHQREHREVEALRASMLDRRKSR